MYKVSSLLIKVFRYIEHHSMVQHKILLLSHSSKLVVEIHLDQSHIFFRVMFHSWKVLKKIVEENGFLMFDFIVGNMKENQI